MSRLAEIQVADDLISRARCGDERAQAHLYAVLAPGTFALIRRLAGVTAVAEDLFQDTMMSTSVGGTPICEAAVTAAGDRAAAARPAVGHRAAVAGWAGLAAALVVAALGLVLEQHRVTGASHAPAAALHESPRLHDPALLPDPIPADLEKEARVPVQMVSAAGAASAASGAERWLRNQRPPALVSVGTQMAVAALEDRLASVDDQLNVARLQQPRAQQVMALQRDRAQLVESLAQVRYAQALVVELP